MAHKWRIDLATRCYHDRSYLIRGICKKLLWLLHSKVLPMFMFLSFFLSLLFWLINISIINSFKFLNIFELCQRFQTYVRFTFGEAIPLWWHFYISDYHYSEERLSEGSEYQYWTPLTLPLIPLYPSFNHSLGSDARVWVWVKGQNTAV